MQSGADGHVLRYFQDIDAFTESVSDLLPRQTDKAVRELAKKLFEFGLMEHEIIVLIDRHVYSRTLQEIVDEHGFTDARVVHRIEKQALAKAKKLYQGGKS